MPTSVTYLGTTYTIPDFEQSEAVQSRQSQWSNIRAGLIALLGTFPGGVDSTNAVYVAKHGSASNSGLNPLAPKLTITQAIAVATALSPTATNQITIYVLDAGIYTESVTLTAYIKIVGIAALIVGAVTLPPNTAIHVDTITNSDSGIAVTRSTGVGAVYVRAKKITSNGATTFSVASSSDFTFIDLDHLENTASGKNFNSGTSGQVFANIRLIGAAGSTFEGESTIRLSYMRNLGTFDVQGTLLSMTVA